MVSDSSKLHNQPFFQHAQNGDKVLVYANQREAIIFSPKRNLIINVGPVNFASPQPSPSTAQTVRIGLRNGTTIVGLTTKVETLLQHDFPNVAIAFRDQDTRTTYESTLIIPLNESAKTTATTLASTLNATVSALPPGESTPADVDILVIVGKDEQ